MDWSLQCFETGLIHVAASHPVLAAMRMVGSGVRPLWKQAAEPW